MDLAQYSEMIDTMQNIQKCIKKKKQYLIDNTKSVELKTMELHKINSSFQSEKASMLIIENQLQNNYKELENLLRIFKETNSENNKILKEIKMEQKVKPSLHDTERLKYGLEKVNLYKNLTGIRWDYKYIDETIKGVITNKKDYVNSFDYPMDTKRVCNKLWLDVYKSVEHINPNVHNENENMN